MQTRQHFNEACKLFIAKYASAAPSFANSPMREWKWNEHTVSFLFNIMFSPLIFGQMLSQLGYMSRNTMLTMKSSNEPRLGDEDLACDIEASPDEATSTTRPDIQTLACREYVVFSATFQVPCLYFAINHPSRSIPLIRCCLSKRSI